MRAMAIALFPFKNPITEAIRMPRGYGDTDVHVVRHQRPFQDLTFFLQGQGVEQRAQLPTDVSENGLPRSLEHKTTWYLQSHFEWALGFDTVLTLIFPQGFRSTRRESPPLTQSINTAFAEMTWEHEHGFTFLQE